MNINKLIGNTPMVKIKYNYMGCMGYVYAKLEYYNYTGSIKDRLINYIILKAKESKKLQENMPIVEATSGNTGISLAALGALYNHPVYIFMPDWVSVERVKIMKLYGAKIYLISKEEGGFKEAIRQADLLAKKINGFRPDQFSNPLNTLVHYETTAVEIINQVPVIDAFISGIGTGGTLIGIAKRLKEYDKDIKIIALEPDKMPLLSQGIVVDNHKIEGIGDDFIPKLVDRKLIDEVITINDDDAINMAKILAKTFGLGVGISSGANFLASVLAMKEHVVTIFADDFKKYLSTDLTSDIDNEDDKYISNKIGLISIESV